MTLGDVHIALHLHLEVYALCVGLLVGYYGLIRRYGPLMHPRPGERAATVRQQLCFVGGVLALWVASASPLHDIAEGYLYSAHMIQHLIQVFVVPPLILLGIPTWMGEILLRPTWLRRVVRGLAKPLVAGIGFNALFIAVHWPAVVNTMVTSEPFHATTHVLLMAAAFLMWMNLASPVPEIVPRMNPLPQMVYLFAMTLVPTVPSAFLTFGDTPLFHVYETFPRVWQGFTALDDMRVAGLIMKIGGGFFLWGVITVLYFRWASSEERAEHGGPSAPPVKNPTDVPTA